MGIRLKSATLRVRSRREVKKPLLPLARLFEQQLLFQKIEEDTFFVAQ